MAEREPVVLTWNEWKAARARKRANLQGYGVATPSRRTQGVGKSDQRLRKAFEGKRVPENLVGKI